MAKIIPFRPRPKKQAKGRPEKGFEPSLGSILKKMASDPRVLEQALEQMKGAIQVAVQESESEIKIRLPLPPIERRSLFVGYENGNLQIDAVSPGVGRVHQVLPIMIPVVAATAQAQFEPGQLEIRFKKKEFKEPVISIPIKDKEPE